MLPSGKSGNACSSFAYLLAVRYGGGEALASLIFLPGVRMSSATASFGKKRLPPPRNPHHTESNANPWVILLYDRHPVSTRGQGSHHMQMQQMSVLLMPYPEAGELFLRFCAFLRQLGVPSAGKTMAPAVLHVLDNGEVEERRMESTCLPGNRPPAGGEEVGASVWCDEKRITALRV